MDRSQGALNQLTSQLTTDYGCDSIKAGKQLLRKLETELAEAEESFDSELATFEGQYGNILE